MSRCDSAPQSWLRLAHEAAHWARARGRSAELPGVGAVPAFPADRQGALSGVQPVEALKGLVDRARAMVG